MVKIKKWFEQGGRGWGLLKTSLQRTALILSHKENNILWIENNRNILHEAFRWKDWLIYDKDIP